MPLVQTVKIWSCDQCGKTSHWRDGWMSKLVLHRKPCPYDEEIVVCSKACADKIDSRKKKA